MRLAKRPEDVRASVTAWHRHRVRRRLARKFLRGTGIEIGALHQPLEVPVGVEVRYLDRLSTEELKAEYPELAHRSLIDVDIVEDGEDPRSLESASLDFVIASHMIEHCEDPIGTIKNWLRLLRSGGVIFLVVPDRRRTFDRGRPPTTVDHLLDDHRKGPEQSRARHYRDWVKIFNKDAPDSERAAEELIEQGYRPHFHVWSPKEFRGFLNQAARQEAMPMRVVGFAQNFREFLVVIERS